MKRVLVIGVSGSGKTYFAKRLAEILSIPVVHLDSIFWNENWVEEDEDVVTQKIQAEINKDMWIIEGYIEPLSAERLAAADQVIYLDLPGRASLRGGLSRMIKHRKTPRPEMPAGNTDKPSIEFLKILYNQNERPEIESAIQGCAKVQRLKSRKQIKKYLDVIAKSHA